MKQAKRNKQQHNYKGETEKQRPREAIKNRMPGAAKKGYNSNLIWILLGIVVITIIVYSNSIANGFNNWDDDEYIVNNLLIRSFNLKAIFTHYLAGNYHPVTELVSAIEYHFWGLTAKGYHIISLFLHICNAVFVFYVILLLSKKKEIAAVTALLFAVHPLHVESVAWVAELKDLLYTFFFLASYICYIKHTLKPDKKFYFLALLLFLLSLLSKGMAASLPVLLVLTDYFIGKKFTLKTLLEKVPFFILSLIFGVVAIYAQRSVNAIQEVPVFPLYDRMVFACYGFVMYLYKLILPLQLSAFYPYPAKAGAGIPDWYYLFPLFFILLVAVVFFSIRYSRKILFGVGFFAITVFLVLQLLPVGSAIMADRYSYIPSIGIFYLAAEGFYWLWNKKFYGTTIKIPVTALLTAFLIFFSLTTYARCDIWKSGMTLWNDMLSKYKDVAFAYNNRGILYLNDEKYDEALRDFNMAIKLQTNYPKAYNNRGIVYSHQKKFEEAKRDYDKAIQEDNNYEEAYTNRGIMFLDANKYEEAINDFSKTISLKPNSGQAYYNRARAEYTLGKKDIACVDLQQAIKLKFPTAQDAYDHLCH